MSKQPKRDFYRQALIERFQAELKENQQKLQHILFVLKRIDVPAKPKTSQVKKNPIFVARRKDQKKLSPILPTKKYSPRIKSLPWEKFLVESMKETKRLYSPASISELGLKRFDLPPNSKYKLRNFLTATLQSNPRFKQHSVGNEKHGYFGLAEWFDGDTLKRVFKKRFT